MFGKTVSEYLDFQKFFLWLLLAVGVARLGLSLAGVPDTTVRWVSMNAVVWVATLYYGVAVHTRGFGSYKQLLPLLVFQMAVFHAIAVLGILLTIAGYPNVYAAPEYSPTAGTSQWLHVLAHLTAGMIAAPLIGWAVASLVMAATKAATGRRQVAPGRTP
jgi:hypothetical protein